MELSVHMDSLMTQLQATRVGQHSKTLTAVAAYEDAGTDTRVNDFCRTLARQLGNKCEVIKHMWLLNELRMPQLRAIAAGEAAGADLIIIAVHHSDAVPLEVKDWIENWLARKGAHPDVLLALFDPLYKGDSSSIRTYLEEVARRGKMQCFVQSEENFDDR
jgi:hypothetical protein